MSKMHSDGIVRVGSTAARKLAEQPVSDWFLKAASSSGDSFAKLKLYAQVCRHDLGELARASLLSSPRCVSEGLPENDPRSMLG